MKTVIAFATDEDIALRAPSDYAILCPRDQKIVAGTDGIISSSNPWILNSASVNFLARGLAPGHVVQLTKPVAVFRSPGETLVVQSVSMGSVTLRRKGQLPGLGQPPGPATVCTGIEFLVTTLAPQIERATFDLCRRYGIDDLIAGRRSSDLYDPREVREAIVLTVLHTRYLDQSREAGHEPDSFALKAKLMLAELDALIDRAVLHWLPVGASTSRFSTRITR